VVDPRLAQPELRDEAHAQHAPQRELRLMRELGVTVV
jgi:hypothetical protein